MTGLSLQTDALVEVAALVTDYELTVLGEGVDVVIRPPEAALAQMGDFVREMHTGSGLLDAARRRHDPRGGPGPGARVRHARGSRRPARRRSAATPSPPTGPSSPATCPTSRRTSTTGSSTSPPSRSSPAAGSRGPTSPRPTKTGGHRALADIRESIAELRYYREAVFVPSPGPSTEQARLLAARHVVDHQVPAGGEPGHRRRVVGSTPGVTGTMVRAAGARHPRMRCARRGGYSSAGRAPGCGPGGRGFKSRYSPHVVRAPLATHPGGSP